MIPSHQHHHAGIQVSLVACLVFSLGFLIPAFANDQNSPKRHSLILRPGTDQIHADQMGTTTLSPSTVPTGPQQPRRAVENPTTPTTTPTLHRKLTKRPTQNTASALSPTQQPLSGANQQIRPSPSPAPMANAVAGTSLMPQTAVPTRTTVPSAGLSSTRSVVVPTTAAATVAPAPTQAPPPSASVAQPLAAIGVGSTSSSSRSGGSRSALSLFKVPAIVNLLQAPPPPLVTPPSNPTTPPPSTTPMQPPSTTPPSTPPATPPPSTPPATPPPITPPPPAPTTGSATLSWTLGSESDLAGYKVYVGTSSGVYNYPGSPFTIGRVNTYTITNLPSGQTYFFALSAYDNTGNNSGLSAEVSKSIF